ncbi:MAG: hypothetical protein WEB58_12340 [Planctomycetaceae bacterium]
MKTSNPFLFFAAALCSIGCVCSTSDLVGPNDEGAIFDPQLLGDVVGTEAKTETYYTHRLTIGDRVIASSPPRKRYVEEQFTRIERKAPDSKTYLLRDYRVPQPSPDGEKLDPVQIGEVTEAHLTKLGNSLFFSSKESSGKRNVYWFGKISRENDQLFISMLEPKWIKEHPEIVPHRCVWDRDITLTATTEQLRDFLTKYADDADVWDEAIPLGRYRKSR